MEELECRGPRSRYTKRSGRIAYKPGDKMCNSPRSRQVPGLVHHVRDPGLAAVVTVEVRSHEDTGTANRRLFAQTRHFVLAVDLVKLQHRELHLLVLVRDLLRLRVHFLLALLSAAVQPRSHEDGRLLTEHVLHERVIVEVDATIDEAEIFLGDTRVSAHLLLQISHGAFSANCDRLVVEAANEDLHCQPPLEPL